MKTYQVIRQDGGGIFMMSEAAIRAIVPDESFVPGLEFFLRSSAVGDVYDAVGCPFYVVRMGRIFTGRVISPGEIRAVILKVGCPSDLAEQALIETSADGGVEEACERILNAD